jgi:hypothetical protein
LVIQIINGGGATNTTLAQLVLNGTEESLCVTNDSKVGVGIANPQRSLEVAGDLVVGGTISGGAGMGSFRNRIINGDMRIAQRGTSFPISGINSNYYYLDRWTTYSSGTFTFSQQTLTASDAPYQVGFTNSLRLTGVGTTTYYEMLQFIEGYNIVDLRWGTSFGAPITVSFWLRSLCTAGSVLAVTIRTSTGSYAYNSPITITNPSTWQYYTITIPPPPNGTTGIGLTNGVGISLDIGPYGGGAGFAPTPNTWLAANYISVAGATNIIGTPGNFIEITGVQLEKGTVATPFEFRPFAQELALCYRYFESSFEPTVTPAPNIFTNYVLINTSNTSTSGQQTGVIPFKVKKRAVGGTVNLYNPFNAAAAVNTTLRVPGATTDVTIISSGGTTDGILVTMTGQPVPLCYLASYTYACEL